MYHDNQIMFSFSLTFDKLSEVVVVFLFLFLKLDNSFKIPEIKFFFFCFQNIKENKIKMSVLLPMKSVSNYLKQNERNRLSLRRKIQKIIVFLLAAWQPNASFETFGRKIIIFHKFKKVYLQFISFKNKFHPFEKNICMQLIDIKYISQQFF